MLLISAIVFSVLTESWSAEDLNFPPGFEFGVASSSYQIEGAWNISDKGESIWDRFTHQANSIPGHANGDVTCDSYYMWKRDIEMIEELGVHFYRFSISWSRIMPNGFSNHISKEGIKYYSDLIDGLLEKDIQPFVTLFHWDLPQKLQDLGGWTNPLISDWFADYARIVYSLYADRVTTWITVNEPVIMCDLAYQFGNLAPGITSGVGTYLCSKHVLLAHAKAWRVYDEEFRPKYHGRVSLVNFAMWFQPSTKEDEDLANLAQQNFIGLYSHPIFTKEGGWPPAVEKNIAEYSKKLGYKRSHLPAFSEKEIELLRGTHDFFALNYYTSRVIQKANDGEVLGPWPIGDAPQLNAKLTIDPSWEKTSTSFYPKHPEGFRKQLNWLKKEYGDIPFLIIENGVGGDERLDDKERITFLRDHMKQVLLAINVDGVNVTTYTVWSLMDSFEWIDGYKTKFGLYNVDFTSPGRERTPRASAVYYTSVIRNRSLDVTEDVIMTHAISTIASKTSYHLVFYIIGGVLAVALITLVVYLVTKQRSKKRQDSYIGVRTDD